MAKKRIAEQDDKNAALSELDKDNKPNLRYWLSQHTASKKAGRQYLDYTDEAWREYLGAYQGPALLKPLLSNIDARFPAFWSSIRTMQPAIYSRTPITEALKMFDSLQDDIARLSSISLERLSKYLINDCPFDRTMYSTRDDFLLSGRCTNRVCFDSEVSSQPKKIYYVQAQVPIPPPPQAAPPPEQQQAQSPPDQSQSGAGQLLPPAPMPQQPPPQFQMVWLDDEGQQLDDPSKLQQDNTDPTNPRFYLESDTELDESLEDCCVELQPVSYKDIRHTPNARNWEEMDWISFRTLMTKSEVRERFGDEFAEAIPYSAQGNRKDVVDKQRDDLLPTPFVEIWETWNKPRKEIMWHVEGWATDFLDIQEDIYDLPEFFPCPPFMLGTVGPDSMYPVPDYVQLKPQILQMHAMARRYKTLVASLKKRAIADATLSEEITNGVNAPDGDILFVKNFQQQIVGKGGLDNIIQFFPTSEYSAAIQEIQQAAADYEAKFNELYGIPDILRGTSDPNETAAAQQLKGTYASLRFSQIQREFQRLVRDAIELMIDLAIKKFPMEKVSDIVGVNFWEPEDQQLWPQIYQLLQDDDERKVRIDIQTDSTITMNQEAEIERANYLAKTLMDGVASIASAEQQDPIFKVMAIHALMMVVDKIPGGKEFGKDLKKAKDAAMEQVENPPPPPTPPQVQVEQMKQQGKAGELQMKAGLEQQKQQGDFQIAQQESASKMQIEQVQAQADIMTELTKIKAEIEQSQIESGQKMQLETMLAGIAAKMKILEAGLKTKEHAQAMIHEDHAAALDRHNAVVDSGLKIWSAKEAVKITRNEASKAYTAKP